MPNLTVAITTKFAPAEVVELERKAAGARVPLRTYIRRCLLDRSELAPETALIVAEIGRLRLLIERLWQSDSDLCLNAEDIAALSGSVNAIDAGTLLSRANGMEHLK